MPSAECADDGISVLQGPALSRGTRPSRNRLPNTGGNLIGGQATAALFTRRQYRGQYVGAGQFPASAQLDASAYDVGSVDSVQLQSPRRRIAPDPAEERYHP